MSGKAGNLRQKKPESWLQSMGVLGQSTVEYTLMLMIMVALAISVFRGLGPVFSRLGTVLEQRFTTILFPRGSEAFHQLRFR